jgi:hypothetical protein
MASEGNQTTHELLTTGVSTSIHDIQERELTMNALLKAVRKYDRIRGDDLEVKNRMRQVILDASKRMIERKRGTHEKSLIYREGTLTRLRGIVSYSNHLCDLLEPVLLHIDEINYARSILGEFMPKLEEAARYATKLDAEMAAELLRVLDTADSLGVEFNQGLREVFEEIIQIHITPRMLDEPSLLIDLAKRRFQEGEYLTSYLLSREAARVLVEDLTGAYPKDLGPEVSPSSEWRFEDYLGYLIEVGLIPEEQGKEFLDLFVGEPEHLNSKWKGKRSAEKALGEMKSYLEKMGLNDNSNDDWL